MAKRTVVKCLLLTSIEFEKMPNLSISVITGFEKLQNEKNRVVILGDVLVINAFQIKNHGHRYLIVRFYCIVRNNSLVIGVHQFLDFIWQIFIIKLQYIVIETMLGGKNSVQGPLLLKLLFVVLKTMSPTTAKHPAHCNIHCVPFKVSIMCSHHFLIRWSRNTTLARLLSWPHVLVNRCIRAFRW